jgi:alanine dehydrogenase
MIKAKLEAKTQTKMSRQRTKTKIKTAAKNKSGKKSATKIRTKPKAKTKARDEGPIFLSEGDVQSLVSVEDAIATLEQLFATWSDPTTINMPRQRAKAGDGTFNLMGAAWGPKHLFGLKAYFGGGGDGRYYALLFSSMDGKLKAMIEADHLGQMRTGAVSGLATKLLAKPDARTLGVIGTGRQAFTQVAAVCAVRKIEKVFVSSRTAEHRDAFARKIERGLRLAALPMPSAEAAIADADIAITITKSAEPVLRANWLKSGVHINAAGANSPLRREVDAESVLRSTVRATDQISQAKLEAAEYRDLVTAGRLQWTDITELGDILTGKAAGRRGPADITLFKSLGIALEDVAFADLILRRAIERGVGKRLP